MKRTLPALIAFCLLFYSIPASAGGKIIIYTNNYEPYYGEQMADYGPLLKITILAFRETGYETEIRFMPWSRAIQEGENGNCDVIAGVWFNKGRENWMALSRPLMINEIGLYKRKQDNLIFKNYRDLKARNVVVGIVQDYINPPEFEKAGLTTEEVTEDILNIRKLVNNRVRLILADRLLGAYLLKKEGRINEIEWLVTLQRIPLRNGFMKKAPGDWKKKLADFNKGLAALQNKGKVDEILKEYNLR